MIMEKLLLLLVQYTKDEETAQCLLNYGVYYHGWLIEQDIDKSEFKEIARSFVEKRPEYCDSVAVDLYL